MAFPVDPPVPRLISRFIEAVRCSIAGPGLLMLFAAAFSQAGAQELPRPSLARIKASQELPKDYNLRLGPLLLNLDASFGTEFTDNVNLASDAPGSSGPEADFLFRPAAGVNARWQVTKLNNLQLRLGVGYLKYLDHPELDSQQVLISPDSAVTFDIYTGDFRINLHEKFSIQQDPVGEGALSNVGKFVRFENVIGASVLWDLNDVLITFGYDHLNFITLGATTAGGEDTTDVRFLDHQTDQVSSSAFFKLGSNYGAGLEGTAFSTRYLENDKNNLTGLTFGPFIEYQPSRYTKIFASIGYQRFSSEGGNPRNDVGNVNANPFFAAQVQPVGRNLTGERANLSGENDGYYGNLTIAHRLNTAYEDQLSLGHQEQVGLFSDRAATTYLNYSSVWRLNRKFSLGINLFFNDVELTGGFLSQNYKRYGGTLFTGFQLSRKTSISIQYQYTEKSAELATQDYRQNRIGITISHKF
jgi:hypothetical protein